MDIRKVKKLIELLEASSVDEIEIKEGEESVRISRNTGAPYCHGSGACSCCASDARAGCSGVGASTRSCTGGQHRRCR
jgi:acetyl-CoA carboxylase biotin carboxyl carrier protein